MSTLPPYSFDHQKALPHGVKLRLRIGNFIISLQETQSTYAISSESLV